MISNSPKDGLMEFRKKGREWRREILEKFMTKNLLNLTKDKNLLNLMKDKNAKIHMIMKMFYLLILHSQLLKAPNKNQTLKAATRR